MPDCPDAIHVKDERIAVLEKEIISAVEESNCSGGGEFYLKLPLTKLNHAQFPVAVVDTPGVNDGFDAKYSHLANEMILALNNPVVLYVSHTRTCGTTDEEKCLMRLADTMKAKGLTEWFVAINGWNYIDPEEDEWEKMKYQRKMRSMANKCGLPEPKIYFVAAMPAELCIKSMEGKTLDRSEKNELTLYLKQFDLYEKARSNRRMLGRVSNTTLRMAMYHSGITSLGRALFSYMKTKAKGQ